MEKSSAAKKLDFLFIAALLYILLFIVYSFIYDSAVFCMFLSLLSLVLVYLTYFGLTHKKRIRNKQNKEEQRHYTEVFYNLPYLSSEKQKEYFKNLFENAGYTANEENGILTATKNGCKRNIYIAFPQADNNDIYAVERQRQETCSPAFILLCGETTKAAENVLDGIDNSENLILYKKQLFDVMKKYDCYPEILYHHKKEKKHNPLSSAFGRNRFKGYFSLGGIMFLFSFVSPFQNYYLIFSAVLFIFCIITLLGEKKPKKEKKDML